MLIAIIFTILISLGGFAITYLIDREETLVWRVSAGSIVGQCVFGSLVFLFAMAVGFGIVSIMIAAVFAILPLILLTRTEIRAVAKHDWAKAKGKLQGANLKKALGFVYYLFFFLLFVAFFDRAYFVNDQGIFTGGSQNLGDLPFHLGIIYSFVDGANIPPQNPSFGGAKLSYPFIPDLITAAFLKLGIGIREAMLVLNVSWAFALLVILERFVYRLVNDKLASRLAPALLFFGGGLGFLWFFSDLGAQTKGFIDFLFNIPKDYTIGTDFRWGNSLVTLFMTQRSLLLGMPLTLLILGSLWGIFNAKAQSSKDARPEFSILHFPFSIFLLGLLAGLLPLVHLHSLFVLFVVTGFLLIFQPAKWRNWVTFGIGVCIIAIPELIWSITGSASNVAEFFQIHIGWDSGETNVFWFWLKNTGLLIPLIAVGIYLIFLTQKKQSGDEESSASLLFQFYVPFIFIFVLANIAKLAPWQWDNIKVLIYWFVGSLPFVALAIAWAWRRSTATKVAAAACLLILIFAGSLDVWRTVSRQINYKVFDAEAATFANRVKPAIPLQAVIVNAPTYNTAAVLTGRLSLIRYPGHLSSHGINYGERETDVKQMYRGGPTALVLFQKYGVEYVLISPEERNSMLPNEAFFAQFPVVAEAGQYKLYNVKK